MSPRTYQQRNRAAAAQETRRRILEAVYERLREAPAEAVSVERVAADAGVSRSTVYVVFGSRAGLFDAFGEYLTDRPEFARLVETTTYPDAREHLRGSLRASVDYYAAQRDVARAVYSMALLDPDAMAGAVQRYEQQRLAGMKGLAGRLHAQGILRPGVSVADAVDTLWVIAAFDTFDLLYTGRGLAPAKVADRLVEMAERCLCVEEAAG